MSVGAAAAWYARQSPRDQRILRIGACAVAAIVLLWLLMFAQRAVTDAREELADKQQLLDYMRQVGPALAAAGPGTAVQPIGESFVVFIDRSAREHGLAQSLTGSPPTGNGAFRVTFENADFNLLLTWMYQLATRYGIQIEATSVNGAGAPGMVSASVQLRPPA